MNDAIVAVMIGDDVRLEELLGRPAWHAEARCSGQTSLMYDADRIDAARALCRRCPVSGPCVMEAIRNRDAFGIRGGLTPSERKLPKIVESATGRARRAA